MGRDAPRSVIPVSSKSRAMRPQSVLEARACQRIYWSKRLGHGYREETPEEMSHYQVKLQEQANRIGLNLLPTGTNGNSEVEAEVGREDRLRHTGLGVAGNSDTYIVFSFL